MCHNRPKGTFFGQQQRSNFLMMKHNYLKQAGQNKRVTAENIMENCHFPEKCLPAHCEIQGFCKIIG